MNQKKAILSDDESSEDEMQLLNLDDDDLNRDIKLFSAF